MKLSFTSQASRNRTNYIMAAFGMFPVIYLAVVIAPFALEGLPGLIKHAGEINFTKISWTPGTPRVIAISLICYSLCMLVVLSSMHKYHRRGMEHGSADWGELSSMRNDFYSSSKYRVRYTENFSISYIPEHLHAHKRNLNTLVVGGPGSSKTRGYVFPNISEAKCSYVVLDPKGEIVRKSGIFLQQHGYHVRVLDLIHPENSWGYNPFQYIRNDDDVQRVVTAIFEATSKKSAQTMDPFWDEAGKMLLSALMYLLVHFGLPKERNFPYVMELVRAGRFEDPDDDTIKSPLDILFGQIAEKYPDHICLRYYQNYRNAPAKTLQSVQITLLARLQKFDLESIGKMMTTDEMALDSLGTERTALFCVIPDNDTSYNFIIALLYIQLFQALYDKADNEYHGPLPVFVHVLMDEFANVHIPEGFLNILATCRSRNIGISIIIQNFAQLKEKYKEGWENILGQCDEFLYLGGNEYSTHEYISKMLGKETIDTNTYGRRYGIHGDYSSNFQNGGRELMTPDEVRRLPYDKALILVKNAPPLIDNKIDPNKAFQPTDPYMYGSREERNQKKTVPTVPKEPSLEETMLPSDNTSSQKHSIELLINGNGTNGNLQDKIALWYQEYELDTTYFYSNTERAYTNENE